MTPSPRAKRGTRLAAALVAGWTLACPAAAEIAPGRLAVLDGFADPFGQGHLGALFEVERLADPTAGITPLASSPDFFVPSDLAFLPDGSLVAVDRDADPSGLGTDPNGENGRGAVFRWSAVEGVVRLLSDGSDYPAGRPPGQPSVFVDPRGIAVTTSGEILVADQDADPSRLGTDSAGFAGHGALFAVDAVTGAVTLVSDGQSSADGPPPGGAASWFEDPVSVATLEDGRIFVLDTFGDPGGTGGSGGVFEVNPTTGEVRLVAASAGFEAPGDIAAAGQELLFTDQLADPFGEGTRGAVFGVDPAVVDPLASTAVEATDPWFRGLGGIGVAPDGSAFIADVFADPLSLGFLGAVFRLRSDGSVAVTSTSDAYGVLASVAVAPPTEPPPTLSAATPASAEQDTVLTVLLEGGDLAAGAEVSFGPGVVVDAVRWLDATAVEVDVTIAPAAAAGTRDVRVTNPDLQAAVLSAGFEVLARPQPVVLAVTPASASQGETLTVDVQGDLFQPGAGVDLGPGVRVAAVRHVDPTLLEADLEVDVAAAPGPRTITVTNPDLETGALVDGFTVLLPEPPDPVTVAPSLLLPGTTVSLDVTGSGFRQGLALDFGAGIEVGPVDVRDATLATCRVHVRADAAPGLGDLVATNADATTGTLLDGFTVADTPALSVVAHAIDDVSTGGNGSGAPDPGEPFGLDLTIWNDSPWPASGVAVRVVSRAPARVVVVREAVSFPDVPALGAARRAGPPFPELQVAEDVPCGAPLPIDVELIVLGFVVRSQRVVLAVGGVSAWPRKPIIDGPDAGGRRGTSVALSDVDGDGIADLLVGGPLEEPGGVFAAGRVTATSGRTDDPLWQLDGEEVNGRLGSSLAPVPDVDGDGLSDLLVGAPGEAMGGGRVHLVSGADGSRIRSLAGEPGSRLGESVAGSGDRDLDGRPDVALGAPAAGAGDGLVLIVRLDDLGEIERLEGAAAEALGSALAWIGDVDDDGRADLVVGAPSAEPAGRIHWWATSAGVSTDGGVEAGEAFGAALASGADVDGDGRLDVLVGAPAASPGGLARAGRAVALSSRSRSPLRELRGGAPDASHGAAVGLMPDADGDGIGELVVGAPGAGADDGQIEVRSVVDGSLLMFRTGPLGAAERFGEALATGADAGGDAFADLLVGAPRASPDGAPLGGRAVTYKTQAACAPYFDCQADPFEPNDDGGDATPLTYGAVAGLSICTSDVDTFTLDPPPDRRMVVRVLFEHARGDLDAELRDATGALVDASLSVTDDEEVGPFGPGGGPWELRVFGFDGATNEYSLVVLDPDSCPPVSEVRDLRVRRVPTGEVLLTWRPSEDPCHEEDPGQVGYRIHAAADPRPAGPGPFPAGTTFVDITAADADGDPADAAYVDGGADRLRFYLVVDVGRAGEDGPVGHYGS